MNDKLTIKQELYCQERLKGSTQRQAYKTAFAPPKMSDKNIDEKASVLEAKGKVKARLKELQEQLANKAVWDREKSLNALIGFYEVAKRQNTTQDRPVDSALVSAGIRAIAEINKMLGLNAPDKVDVGSQTLDEVRIKFVNKSQRNQKSEIDPKIVGEYTPPSNITEGPYGS